MRNISELEEKARATEIVKTGIAFDISKDKIIDRLQERLGFSKEEALENFEMYKEKKSNN